MVWDQFGSGSVNLRAWLHNILYHIKRKGRRACRMWAVGEFSQDATKEALGFSPLLGSGLIMNSNLNSLCWSSVICSGCLWWLVAEIINMYIFHIPNAWCMILLCKWLYSAPSDWHAGGRWLYIWFRVTTVVKVSHLSFDFRPRPISHAGRLVYIIYNIWSVIHLHLIFQSWSVIPGRLTGIYSGDAAGNINVRVGGEPSAGG